MPIKGAQVDGPELPARRGRKMSTTPSQAAIAARCILKEFVIHTHAKNVGGEADRLRNTRGGIE
jgi:hypothetical protein